MDIRVLRYFLAVAREENITRAAESLHIAQPSLSKQLMELEQELGKKLLLRGKRKITLTEDGILLRKRADEIIHLVEKTEREISSDSREISGEISIGGSTPATILKSACFLREKYPDIRFYFYRSDATEIAEQLEHSTLDFAVFLAPVDHAKYESILLPDTSQWGLLLPADSDLSQHAAITGDILRTVPLILHRRIGLQREIARWARTDVEQLTIAATYNAAHGSAVDFVKSGLGAFVITRDQLSGDLDSSVCFRPLEPPLEIRYALTWKRYAVFSKAAEVFLETVNMHVREAAD